MYTEVCPLGGFGRFLTSNTSKKTLQRHHRTQITCTHKDMLWLVYRHNSDALSIIVFSAKDIYTT